MVIALKFSYSSVYLDFQIPSEVKAVNNSLHQSQICGFKFTNIKLNMKVPQKF